MWKVIWLWKFPEHGKVSYAKLSENESLENVFPIPTQLNMEDSFEKEFLEFQREVNLIVETIINYWIQDYIDSMKQKNTIRNIKELEKQTEDIWKEMMIKAHAIEYTIEYIEDGDLGLEFTNNYILWAITDLLGVYRDEVFDLLVTNASKDK